MKCTSQPLLIGTEFMPSHKIGIYFNNMHFRTDNVKVKCKREFQIQPASKFLVKGQTHKGYVVSRQGTVSKRILKKGILAARSVDTAEF